MEELLSWEICELSSITPLFIALTENWNYGLEAVQWNSVYLVWHKEQRKGKEIDGYGGKRGIGGVCIWYSLFETNSTRTLSSSSRVALLMLIVLLKIGYFEFLFCFVGYLCQPESTID